MRAKRKTPVPTTGELCPSTQGLEKKQLPAGLSPLADRLEHDKPRSTEDIGSGPELGKTEYVTKDVRREAR